MTTRHEGQGTSNQGPAEINYADWSAPTEDGGLLIWPQARQITDLARQNADLLAKSDASLGGVPLRDLRSAARRFLGQKGDVPLIATGHQCELQHPGVWIKNAVICAAAQACGGAALHIAVDTDAPKHLKLKWPGFWAPITDDPRANGAAWSGLLSPPTAGHLESLLREVEAARSDGRVSELLLNFLRLLGEAGRELAKKDAGTSLPEALLAAQRALDAELGLKYLALPLSNLLETEQHSRFVLAIACDARNFAAIYNTALHDFRRKARIDSPERPAPDLLVTRKHVEIPFWLDNFASGERHRAELVEAGGGLALAAPANGAAFNFSGNSRDPTALLAWLREHRLRLAPRALPLTMFLRLVVCDLFVHGIGGGVYDQVTDRIIRNWLGTEPPAFAVATATLFHPLAAGRKRPDLAALRREEHKQAHEVLGSQKRNWLQRIAAARDPHERRGSFEAMHRARRQAMAVASPYLEAHQRLHQAMDQSSSDRGIFDRELFYAIQPPQRLVQLIELIRRDFGLRH